MRGEYGEVARAWVAKKGLVYHAQVFGLYPVDSGETSRDFRGKRV